jgi:hypothetical protein
MKPRTLAEQEEIDRQLDKPHWVWYAWIIGWVIYGITQRVVSILTYGGIVTP